MRLRAWGAKDIFVKANSNGDTGNPEEWGDGDHTRSEEGVGRHRVQLGILFI